VRLDLTVSESDLPSLKVGQYGMATFDALAGRPVIVRIRGISSLPTVSQGVVTYPVQAEIVTGDALREAREQLAAMAGGAARAGGTTGAGAAGGAATKTGGLGAGGLGGGQRAQGAGGQGGGLALGGGEQALPSPGMNASVTLLLNIENDVLQVPNAAIKRENRQATVTIKRDDGTQEAVPVTTGSTNGTNTVITEGLSEGQTALIISQPTTAKATGTASPKTGTQGGNFRVPGAAGGQGPVFFPPGGGG
jgi:hypothetical protein